MAEWAISGDEEDFLKKVTFEQRYCGWAMEYLEEVQLAEGQQGQRPWGRSLTGVAEPWGLCASSQWVHEEQEDQRSEDFFPQPG